MTAPSPPADPARIASGLGIMTVAMLVVPLIDAIAKLLSAEMSPIQISWSRFVLTLFFLAPVVVWRSGWAGLRPPRFGLHMLRGAGIAGATVFFFAALASMPMADVAAIFFIEPLVLTIFSAIFLGESIGWRRITAVVVGFAGAMLIIRPSFADVGITALLPVAAAFCFAGYMTLTKLLSGTTDAWTMQTMAGISGSVLLGIVLLIAESSGMADAIIPDLRQAGLLLTIAVVAVACHTAIIFALRRVDAGLIAPLQYLEIIGATAYGYLLFNDFPDAMTWLGIAIIVGSGIFVFHRERVSA